MTDYCDTHRLVMLPIRNPIPEDKVSEAEREVYEAIQRKVAENSLLNKVLLCRSSNACWRLNYFSCLCMLAGANLVLGESTDQV